VNNILSSFLNIDQTRSRKKAFPLGIVCMGKRHRGGAEDKRRSHQGQDTEDQAMVSEGADCAGQTDSQMDGQQGYVESVCLFVNNKTHPQYATVMLGDVRDKTVILPWLMPGPAWGGGNQTRRTVCPGHHREPKSCFPASIKALTSTG
jgi:hypothetical protein